MFENQGSERSIIIIGDLHGRNIWKDIVALHPADSIVFLGDYFDSKENISAPEQINNFNEILHFKRQNPSRVTLLMGNHDFHYLPQAGETYSGYQRFFHNDIWEAIEPAFTGGDLQVCMQAGEYLISHAGLTRTWCFLHDIPFNAPMDPVNELMVSNVRALAFSPGPIFEKSGDEPQQGPLWVRPDSLKKDALPGFIHVVGHTQQPDIRFYPDVIIVDVFSFSPKYLLIMPDGQAIIRSL